MATRHTFSNVVSAITLAAAVFFGVRVLDSLDRVRRTQGEILEAVSRLKHRSAAVAPVAALPGGGAFANREYFDPAAEPGGKLVRATGSDAGILNPVLSNDAAAADFDALVNAPLGERDYASPELFRPLLAEKVEPLDGGLLAYRVTLRDGLFWQDVTDPVTGVEHRDVPVTAADFKFFADVVTDERVNCAPLRSYYADLESLEVLSDREFIVRWREPFFRTGELTMGLRPLPRHFYLPDGEEFDAEKFNNDHLRNTMLVGCGAYRLSRYEKNRVAEFERYDRYIGGRFGAAPPIEKLIYEVVPHPNTVFQMLIGHDLDAAALSAEQWVTRTDTEAFTGNAPEFEKVRHSRMAYFYIGWNLRNPLFADRDVRAALTMLTDRGKILEEVFHGLGEIQNGPFYMQSPACDSSISPLPFDPAGAAELLAAAGWRDDDRDGVLEKDGQKFSFTLCYPADSPNYEAIMTIIKEDMARVGVDLRMQAVEWSVLVQKIDNRDFEAVSLGWRMSFEQDPYQLWHSSQSEVEGGSNLVGFRSAEADSLIEAIRREPDPEKRKLLYHRFHRLIHEEQPYTFLIAPDALWAISTKYRNRRVFPLGVAWDVMWEPTNE